MSVSRMNHYIEVLKSLEDPMQAVASALFMALLTLQDRDSYKDSDSRWQLSSIQDWIDYLLVAHPVVSGLFDRSDSFVLLPPNGTVTRLLGNKGRMALQSAGSDLLPSYVVDEPSPEYQICISFAEEDRAFAEQIAAELKKSQVRVFYDADERFATWGHDLYSYLYRVYAQESMMCVVLFSRRYREKAWTRHELRAAQARAIKERSSYILPIRMHDEELPEEFKGIAYLRAEHVNAAQIAQVLCDRLGGEIEKHYIRLDLIFGMFFHEELMNAIRQSINLLDEPINVLTTVTIASIAMTSEAVSDEVRGFFNYLVFIFPPIASRFENNEFSIGEPNIRVGRFYNRPFGPLFFKKEFGELIRDRAREITSGLANGEEEDEDEPDDYEEE